MPPLPRLFGSFVAPAVALLLAACVTGSPPPAGDVPAAPLPEDAAFTQLAVGEDHACGLTADGTASCWGRNDEGQLDVPAGTRFRRLAAGNQFSCGLRSDGPLVCWGRGAADWLDGESGTWSTVSAGSDLVCALDAEGAIACWGSPPPPPPEEGRYAAIGVGEGYVCGLTLKRDLTCWGDIRWIQVEWIEGPFWRDGPFEALSVGLRHLCALRPGGGAVCHGVPDGRIYPPDTVYAHVAAGEYHSCGLAAETPECWGSDEDPPAGPFTALASGWRNVCGLRPGGEVRCWRMNRIARPRNLAPAFGGRAFDQPVELFPWPGGGLAIADREGTVTVHHPAAPSRVVLDLTDRVVGGGDRGLLSVAPDPEFASFPFVYAWYTTPGADDDSVHARLSRLAVVGDRVDAESELVILEFPLRFPVRQGGAVRFGPDGMLYLSLGDGKANEQAQDLGDPRGKIFRIDVRGATDARPYRIPDDNPFLATPGARPEIWARGVRSPWRMSFDAAGRLWLGDVGQMTEEEVSLVAPGANLGWPVFEGTRCFAGEDACAALTGATPPVASYGHELGCAVIGGVHVPPDGPYLFGDHCSRRIWALEDGGEAGWTMREIARASHPILSFGMGVDGEVYVLTQGGPILRLELPP